MLVASGGRNLNRFRYILYFSQLLFERYIDQELPQKALTLKQDEAFDLLLGCFSLASSLYGSERSDSLDQSYLSDRVIAFQNTIFEKFPLEVLDFPPASIEVLYHRFFPTLEEKDPNQVKVLRELSHFILILLAHLSLKADLDEKEKARISIFLAEELYFGPNNSSKKSIIVSDELMSKIHQTKLQLIELIKDQNLSYILYFPEGNSLFSVIEKLKDTF